MASSCRDHHNYLIINPAKRNLLAEPNTQRLTLAPE